MQTDNPRRAAVELSGALVIAGALLAAPFVYLNLQVDKVRRPAPERVAVIEHSDCAGLREQLARERGSSSPLDLRSAETMQLIVKRGEQLRCRPAILLPASPND
jgi:hypothetical protein